jgi:transposase
VGCDGVHEEPKSAAGGEFLAEVVRQAQANGLTSDEHFSVDGTLIEAWASLKSLSVWCRSPKMRRQA